MLVLVLVERAARGFLCLHCLLVFLQQVASEYALVQLARPVLARPVLAPSVLAPSVLAPSVLAR